MFSPCAIETFGLYSEFSFCLMNQACLSIGLKFRFETTNVPSVREMYFKQLPLNSIDHAAVNQYSTSYTNRTSITPS